MTIRRTIAATCFALSSCATLFGNQSAASTLTDAQDSRWTALGSSISFEVVYTNPNSLLNNSGLLGFGFYEVGNTANKTTIFNDIMTVGDTSTVTAPAFSNFGFFLENSGASFDGPFTYYSDSSLNLQNSIYAPTAGLDAMLVQDIGGGAFELIFEDLFLPIGGSIISSADPFDLRIVSSGDNGSRIAPVPLPAGGLLLAVGLIGIVRLKRQKQPAA